MSGPEHQRHPPDIDETPSLLERAKEKGSSARAWLKEQAAGVRVGAAGMTTRLVERVKERAPSSSTDRSLSASPITRSLMASEPPRRCSKCYRRPHCGHRHSGIWPNEVAASTSESCLGNPRACMIQEESSPSRSSAIAVR